MPNSAGPYLGYFPDTEIIFGISYALGTEYGPVLLTLRNYVEQFGYQLREIKLSDLFEGLLEKLEKQMPYFGDSTLNRMKAKIEAGNLIRSETKNRPGGGQCYDVMSLVAASEIASGRKGIGENKPEPKPKELFAIISLKHPDEVECLRRIYGAGFYLIGIASTQEARMLHLTAERGLPEEDAADLIRTDAEEKPEHGQKTRDTFYLSDVFISLKDEAYKKQISRFLDLIFGHPFETPTLDEHAMHMAYAASLRSGDLARQVGAALVGESGDLIAVGCNDVPTAGGGLYWPGSDDQRDHVKGEDSNDREKYEMAVKILGLTNPEEEVASRRERAKKALAGTGFFDITEFGRSVHAEMDALLTCARGGRSTRGAVLYTTTFPCHNCTRHIIAAGVSKVVYVEPYAKSRAFELHDDAIAADEGGKTKIPFVPFVGVGPRRYLDLFSMKLGTGYPLERKRDGNKINWERSKAEVRLQMQPSSYLNRELQHILIEG